VANQRNDSRQSGVMSRELALSLYLPAAMLSLGTGIAGPAIPILSRSFDVSLSTAALVIVVHAWGGIVSTLPTGYMIDKIGRRPVMLIGPALTALTAFMTAFAGSFEELLLYRFINGYASQMWVQGRLAMIADTGRDRDRGKLITWMAGTQRFGMLFSPVIGGMLGEWDIRAPFIAHGILVTIILIPLSKLIKESSPTRKADGTPEETADWREVRHEMLKPQVLFFLTAQLFANLTRGGGGQVMSLYVAFAYDVGPQTLGILSAVNAAIVIPMTFATGVIMDKVGRKMTVVPGFLLFASFSFAIAASSVYGMDFYPFLVLYFLLHASQGLTAGNMQVLGSDLAPPRIRGRFFSYQRFAGELGGVLSPTMFSILSAISYAAAFNFVGGCGIIVAWIIAFKVKDVVGSARRERVREAASPAEPPAEPVAAAAVPPAQEGSQTPPSTPAP
jgi:MFS family permease